MPALNNLTIGLADTAISMIVVTGLFVYHNLLFIDFSLLRLL
jgi:hypothetical protein